MTNTNYPLNMTKSEYEKYTLDHLQIGILALISTSSALHSLGKDKDVISKITDMYCELEIIKDSLINN